MAFMDSQSVFTLLISHFPAQLSVRELWMIPRDPLTGLFGTGPASRYSLPARNECRFRPWKKGNKESPTVEASN